MERFERIFDYLLKVEGGYSDDKHDKGGETTWGITKEEARKNGYDNYTCADDISLLLKLIYQEKLINKEASQLILDILLRQQQGERLQRYLPSDIKIAHKCGDLDNLENDGGIIWLGGKAYILVILTNGMPNLQCKQTIGKISKFVYDKMEE